MSARQPRPFSKETTLASAAGRKGGQASALSRRASKTPWAGTIIDLMDAADMRGPDWFPWRVFWKATYGLPLGPGELALYQRHTKRTTPSTAPVDEAFMVIGRGGGKTRNASLHALYRAITFDSSRVAAGELVTIPLLAKDRKQSRLALGYVRGFCKSPGIAPYVFRGELKETVEFKTGVTIEIATATFRGSRGYTSPTVCCDEIAYWLDEGSNPDHEIVTAVRGTLGRVPGSLLLVLSSPYAPRGELFEAVERSFGKDDPETLVWMADTVSMNPTYSTRAIARAFKRDPVVAASEFGSDGMVQFRQARQALVDEDAVRVCTVIDRRELPPMPGIRYVAFVDAAQGQRSGDAMTLALAHGEGTRAVLDLVREVQPPFDPGAVIRDVFAPLLHAYGIREVQGDRHAVGFVLNEFATMGITFTPSLLSKSDLFSELLPLVNTARVELLDHSTLRTQLLALERRAVRGGRDSIDHPRGAHDDVANAAAGALVMVTGIGLKPKQRVYFSLGDGMRVGDGRPVMPTTRQQREATAHAAMLQLIRQEEQRAARQAERDWEQAQLDGGYDGPMLGEILGGGNA